MTIKLFALLTAFLFSVSALSMPKIAVKHQRNAKGFAQVQVSNKTMENLICHVAIDGNKILFRLKAIEYSKWFTATDIRYNHSNFSIWCDYLSLHPKYQKR
ncbi:hypothetical protein [Colwellia psychrerythraea]|uniref:Uncharacterized protein n=1 Tax=Colwellia psychrerythraea TaxID=28229 RepID=A0A099KS02_COLPS|nr:hypothetical protein [Colwellia psychrerythraea]KGJ92612.1 hypothetical protein ND2E_2860 [Colwellia psychrerythraea]